MTWGRYVDMVLFVLCVEFVVSVVSVVALLFLTRRGVSGR